MKLRPTAIVIEDRILCRGLASGDIVLWTTIKSIATCGIKCRHSAAATVIEVGKFGRSLAGGGIAFWSVVDSIACCGTNHRPLARGHCY